MSETQIDIYEVVKKLIGPINPVGATHIDEKRLENLKELTRLVDNLLSDIDKVLFLCGEDSTLYSVKAAGQHARKFFDKIGIVE